MDDVQYNFASFEGSSYCSCICKVQRYIAIDRWLCLLLNYVLKIGLGFNGIV